jgi:hypothetical protein
MRFILAFALVAAMTSPQAQDCTARSGPGTAVLVELYTSEGCSSCPPADRWLQTLGGRGYAPARVVPLSLHVTYWDYIGWKDPYAQQRFSERQRELAQVLGARFVYTPQVMLQGRDFRGWGGGDFDARVSRINATPARASIALRIGAGRKDMLDTTVEAALLDPAGEGAAVLYLASYENNVVSRVSAGENEGRTLQHDFVVLEWVGPLPFTGGRLAERRRLPLPPTAARARSGVAAFVQDRRTAEVLQALMLPACPS